MNSRSSGPGTLLLFLFLSVVILLQVLSMIQSDRLYERLNHLAEIWKSSPPAFIRSVSDPGQSSGSDRYPGDEGDWLIWRLAAEPATLTPIHTSAGVASKWVVSGTIFETLLEYDPDTIKLKPLLAESYHISDDGLKISYKLRDDIFFSDGHPVTADDVVFSYETVKNPEIDATTLASYLKDVDRVEKISDREVEFFMKRVYFKSLEITGGLDIFPKHIYQFDDPQEFNKRISNPVGSGPYVFEKWNVGREVVLKRNENYWGKIPNLEKIVYRVITNDSGAIQSLRSGDVDFLRPLPDQYTDLANDAEFTKDFKPLSYWTPGSGYFWMGWNQEREFFKDKKVRQAMTHLVDREKICKYLLKNPDAVVPTGPFYIHGDQCDKTIKPWPYDPEKAKQLLDAAGWIDTDGDGIRDKDGVPFRFTYMIVSGTYLHEQISKLLKDESAKVGIDVQIDPYEWSVFIQRLIDRKFDSVNLAWHGAVESDPYQIWHTSQIGNRGSNYIGFGNDESDALIEQARITIDRDERNKLYNKFHRIIHEQQPYTFIYTRPEQRFLHKRFEGVNVHILGLDQREWFVPLSKQKYK